VARRPACFAVILIGNGADSQPFRQFSSGFGLVIRAVNLVSVDMAGLLRRRQGGAYKEVLLGILLQKCPTADLDSMVGQLSLAMNRLFDLTESRMEGTHA
jgi:hypothetical protein